MQRLPRYGRLFSIANRFVCRVSVVCNLCALTQPVKIFWQFFYALLYLSHLLTYVQNFPEIVPGKFLRLGLKARGVAKYSDCETVEGCISETVKDTASGIQLMTIRKSFR